MITNYKKKYQELLIEFNKVNKHFDSMIGSYLHETSHSISHIGTTLNSIERKHPKIPKDIQKDFDRLRMEFNRLKAIWSATAHFYRSNDKDLEKDDIIVFSLYDAVYEIKNLVRFKLEQHEIRIIIDPIINDFRVVGSISKLQHALLNVIKNSIESSYDSNHFKEINIRFKPTKKMVSIEIEDYGKGIPKELGNQIFELGVTTKENKQGLGLSLAKQVIEQEFKGTINIVSYKKPTIFKINIPLYE